MLEYPTLLVLAGLVFFHRDFSVSRDNCIAAYDWLLVEEKASFTASYACRITMSQLRLALTATFAPGSKDLQGLVRNAQPPTGGLRLAGMGVRGWSSKRPVSAGRLGRD